MHAELLELNLVRETLLAMLRILTHLNEEHIEYLAQQGIEALPAVEREDFLVDVERIKGLLHIFGDARECGLELLAALGQTRCCDAPFPEAAVGACRQILIAAAPIILTAQEAVAAFPECVGEA